ncbi:MAG: NTP pyrophosphohydrolase [Bacillota bacterium]|nr:MAG: NTP pyrophosphohydrolase [Bacillota bacterium]MBS3950194.1 NUDIX domain-containing protein [Peptococcaceae bacterium]
MDYRRIRTQAIIMRGHHVLMVRTPGDHWMLPGGDAEEGETPEDALIRTVSFETGAEIKVIKHLTREKNVHEPYRLVLTFLGELESLSYDPSTYIGPLEVDWRSMRAPELKEEIYDKHLAGKERQ